MKSKATLLFCFFLLAGGSPICKATFQLPFAWVLPAENPFPKPVGSPVLTSLEKRSNAFKASRHSVQKSTFWSRLKAKFRKVAPGIKRRGVALLLGLFLGLFGVHRFYLGYKEHGFGYLITIITVIVITLLGLVLDSFVLFGFLLILLAAVPILAALVVFLLVDLIRIAAGTLKYKEKAPTGPFF